MASRGQVPLCPQVSQAVWVPSEGDPEKPGSQGAGRSVGAEGRGAW